MTHVYNVMHYVYIYAAAYSMMDHLDLQYTAELDQLLGVTFADFGKLAE